MSFPAFFDTCALYPAALNDLVLELAEQGVYRALWSATVLEELERNLALRVAADKARYRVASMRFAFPDAEVLGYESLVDKMTCHEKDRHVVAAAVRAKAETIVTFNLRDFPDAALAPYDIQAIHPDAFLLDQLDLYQEVTLAAVQWIAEGYESPPMTAADYLEKLARAGVPEFAKRAAVLL